MRQSFFERYGRDLHQKIVALGASFSDLSETPHQMVSRDAEKRLLHLEVRSVN